MVTPCRSSLLFVTELGPTARVEPQIWSYTTTVPPPGWILPSFDASAWKTGPAGFGTAGTPTIVLHTVWNTDDIWLRREITVPNIPASGHLVFLAYHDEDIEIYVNGVKASSEGGYQVSYVPLEITPPALKLLTPGAKVMIAVHCHQTTGGQGVDVGLASIIWRGSDRIRDRDRSQRRDCGAGTINESSQRICSYSVTECSPDRQIQSACVDLQLLTGI